MLPLTVFLISRLMNSDSLPATQQDNEAEAKRLTPMFIEGLIAQLK